MSTFVLTIDSGIPTVNASFLRFMIRKSNFSLRILREDKDQLKT